MMNILKANFILFFCLFCLAPSSMNAQNYVGLRTGVNFANVTKTNTMGAIAKDRIPLLGAELHAKFGLRANWAIQAEWHLIQRGFQRYINSMNDIWYKFNYFNFNPLVQYRFKQKAIKGPKVKRKKYKLEGYLTTGPYFGYALSGNRLNQYNVDGRSFRLRPNISLF